MRMPETLVSAHGRPVTLTRGVDGAPVNQQVTPVPAVATAIEDPRSPGISTCRSWLRPDPLSHGELRPADVAGTR
jgi:hypothetical protein